MPRLQEHEDVRDDQQKGSAVSGAEGTAATTAGCLGVGLVSTAAWAFLFVILVLAVLLAVNGWRSQPTEAETTRDPPSEAQDVYQR